MTVERKLDIVRTVERVIKTLWCKIPFPVPSVRADRFKASSKKPELGTGGITLNCIGPVRWEHAVSVYGAV